MTLPEIELNITTEYITAKPPRKLKAVWTCETNDLRSWCPLIPLCPAPVSNYDDQMPNLIKSWRVYEESLA